MQRRTTIQSHLQFAFCFMLLAPFLLCTFPARAQVDAHSLLVLPFDNSLNGTNGQQPTTASGYQWQAGIKGEGAYFGTGNTVRYSTSGNINAQEGTFSCWI